MTGTPLPQQAGSATGLSAIDAWWFFADDDGVCAVSERIASQLPRHCCGKLGSMVALPAVLFDPRQARQTPPIPAIGNRTVHAALAPVKGESAIK
jgi:hypothetical protein